MLTLAGVCRTRRASPVVGAVVCTAAALSASAGEPAPLAFTEEGVQRGVNYLIGTPHAQFGAGLGLVDLNLDGHLDIVVLGASNGLVGIYQNLGGGTFANRSFTAGIGPITAAGLSAADYDGDGDPDLYISGWMSPSRLLRNNGNFTFTDVTDAAGVAFTGPACASAWSDVNGDGWLDLYLTVRTGTNANFADNRFFMNNGDGTFAESAVAMGVACPGDPSLIPAFFDFDRDGDDDLYIGTDKGSGGVFSNRMFRNDAGAFTEITAQSGAEAHIDCMGFAIGDLDFDGFFDIYMTNLAIGNKLFMNDAGAGFVDRTADAGMGLFRFSWATVFADFDDDTHLDTYVCVSQSANALFRGAEAWPMADVGESAGVDLPGLSYSVAVGDVDGDLRPDMLVCDTANRVKLFMNRTESGNHAVRFRVVGQGANTQAIGAQLDLRTGDRWQARQVRSGVNYKAMNELVVHFGLGQATVADQVTVRWPGTGATRVLTNVPGDRQWTVYPPERLGDADGNGVIDRREARRLFLNMTGPGVPIQPGQEIYDLDGDFDIDATDLQLLSSRMPPNEPRPRLP